MTNDLKCITVFGSGTIGTENPLYQTAYELGFLLGKAGFTHVSGGYGGTMEAGAKGARDAGAKTIGITVESWGPPNPYIIECRSMPNLFRRLEQLMKIGQGYIVLPGATGTLLEFALAWERINKHIDRPKPIVLLGDFWLPVVDFIKRQIPDSRPADVSHPDCLFGGFLWHEPTPEKTVHRIISRILP